MPSSTKPTLKQAMADAIFADMNDQVVFRNIDGREFGEIQNILFARIDNLSTQIRVKTKTDGIHYFTLKLTENL